MYPTETKSMDQERPISPEPTTPTFPLDIFRLHFQWANKVAEVRKITKAGFSVSVAIIPKHHLSCTPKSVNDTDEDWGVQVVK